MTARERLEHIEKELETLRQAYARYNAGMNEGGEGYTPYAAALRVLEDERDTLQESIAEERCAAIRDARLREWTRELTEQRRAAWNAWVKNQGPTIHTITVAQRIKEQGWSVEDLKEAIKRHGL